MYAQDYSTAPSTGATRIYKPTDTGEGEYQVSEEPRRDPDLPGAPTARERRDLTSFASKGHRGKQESRTSLRSRAR